MKLLRNLTNINIYLYLKIRLYWVAPRIKLKALKRSFIQKVFLLII